MKSDALQACRIAKILVAKENRLNIFKLSRYRISLQASTPLSLPPYKGSYFRGGFGYALKDLSPELYSYFFEPGHATLLHAHSHGQDAPKPFVLVPPLDGRTPYLPGEKIVCELVLFGKAIEYFPDCVHSFALCGKRGIGPGKGRFEIVDVEKIFPDYGKGMSLNADTINNEPLNKSINGLDIVSPYERHDSGRVTLAFLTRLRLKHNNRLLRKPPSFELFFSRLISRLNMLSKMYCGGEILEEDEIKGILDKAGSVELVDSNLSWEEWRRYSYRQRDWMKFGGLLGYITFEGNMAPFMPYIVLGEWTHVGGKTSFGLGRYIVDNMY